MNEELLREAFRLGQQWVHDQYNGGDAVTFNEWYNSKTTQDSLKKLRLGVVMDSVCEHPPNLQDYDTDSGLQFCDGCGEITN